MVGWKTEGMIVPKRRTGYCRGVYRKKWNREYEWKVKRKKEMKEAQTSATCPGEEAVEGVGAWKKNRLVSAASWYRLGLNENRSQPECRGCK